MSKEWSETEVTKERPRYYKHRHPDISTTHSHSPAHLLTCPGGFPNIVSIKTFSSKTAARLSLATNKNSYFREREGELWQCQCQCYWIKYETGVQFQRNGKSPEISLTLSSMGTLTGIFLRWINSFEMESKLICLFVCVAHLLFVAIHVLGLSSFVRQQKTDASQHEQRTIPRSSTNAV